MSILTGPGTSSWLQCCWKWKSTNWKQYRKRQNLIKSYKIMNLYLCFIVFVYHVCIAGVYMAVGGVESWSASLYPIMRVRGEMVTNSTLWLSTYDGCRWMKWLWRPGSFYDLDVWMIFSSKKQTSKPQSCVALMFSWLPHYGSWESLPAVLRWRQVTPWTSS